MVNAAIVGLGRWGRALVRAAASAHDFRFTTAHTRTPQPEFCAQSGLIQAPSYDSILADPAIDAVVLATPHSQHEAQVRQAAAAGKHVLVEKPIALSRASAEAAIQAANAAGIVLAVGFVRRFHPSIGEIRTRIGQGALGPLVGMAGRQTSGTARFLPSTGWRADPAESPAGALTAVGVHLLDHMIEFGGRVADVTAAVASRASAHADTTTILLRFESGLAATLFCSVGTAPDFSFAVYGADGMIEITQTDLRDVRLVGAPTEAPTGPVRAPPPEHLHHPGFDMLAAELSAFASSIRTGEPFPVGLADVLHGMDVFDAIVHSARTGQPRACSVRIGSRNLL